MQCLSHGPRPLSRAAPIRVACEVGTGTPGAGALPSGGLALDDCLFIPLFGMHTPIHFRAGVVLAACVLIVFYLDCMALAWRVAHCSYSSRVTHPTERGGP